eukprot:2708323-Amphidinium_carterae.1
MLVCKHFDVSGRHLSIYLITVLYSCHTVWSVNSGGRALGTEATSLHMRDGHRHGRIADRQVEKPRGEF